MFPTLLKELMASLAENQEENLKSGFSKCGIYLLNKQKLLDRLPENQNADTSAVGEAFIEQLKQRRAEFLTKDGPQKRKKKLQVPAGKSVSLRDLEEVEENSKQYTSTGGTTAKKSRTSLKLKKLKIKRTLCYPKEFSSDEDDIEMVLVSDGETETFSDIEEILLERSGQKASVELYKYPVWANKYPVCSSYPSVTDQYHLVQVEWLLQSRKVNFKCLC